MIKITIDENILKLTPRSKKIGKRLLWGWLSLQVFTIVLILSVIALFIWAGSRNFLAERKAEKFGETTSILTYQDHPKTE